MNCKHMNELSPRVKQHLRDQTLLSDGATILNPFQLPAVPLTGYIVGKMGFTTDYDALDNDTKWEAIMQLTESQLGPLMVGTALGIGVWKCNNDGNLHIHVDVIQWTQQRVQAIALCLINNQKAYYDIEQGESIYVRADQKEDIG